VAPLPGEASKRASPDRERLMHGSMTPMGERGRAAGRNATNEVGRGGEWDESEVAGPDTF
jgi:hypothetical protein